MLDRVSLFLGVHQMYIIQFTITVNTIEIQLHFLGQFTCEFT